MRTAVIENPVINSPFDEPLRHFRFEKDEITNDVVPDRRVSTYFVPIPQARVRGGQTQLVLGETPNDEERPNELINAIRMLVKRWRSADYEGLNNPVTRRLLEHWKREDREKRLFFCQIEAAETAIFIAEAAHAFRTNATGRFAGKSIDEALREANEASNSPLPRLAFKMATGSGKTLVMAMLIAWQSLNKFLSPNDGRFSSSFLIITPGITIRDRLRVLLPNDPGNCYKMWDIVPEDLRQDLGKIKVVITNYHGFLKREKTEASQLTKAILVKGKSSSPFTETVDEMVNRVCREFGRKPGKIIVINDEAHHCYRQRAEENGIDLKGEDKKEAEKRAKAARVWINGLEAVQKKIGINKVYDLSATPFFLRGSGYGEGTLFPWVVSDFSLIDAIESGIVKVPRVPISDDSMTGTQPVYRDLWLRIREDLPKQGRRSHDEMGTEPVLPVELQGALHSLYDNYVKYYQAWESNITARENGQTPPVFIVVCNNTSVSKLVYDYISGWQKPLKDDKYTLVPGRLGLFSNVSGRDWLPRPNTVLIDSEQLESGEAMSREFKEIARTEIDEFKEEMRARFPGRNVDEITDEDLLREVMNTVGKQGKLGENIKCVVSVSMLTEGWDANTVTHVLGVRAFGTQLLCEQVVGRGLRRRSYALQEHKINVQGEEHTVQSFAPEYAEVYGVPFNFIHSTGKSTDINTKPVIRVRALDERCEMEISFPRVMGYRHDLPAETLRATFTLDSHLSLSTQDIATRTEMRGIAGATAIHELEEYRNKREQQVAFHVAKLMLEKYYRDDERNVMAWFFPSLLEITKRWMQECLHFKDNTFVGMLLMDIYKHDAADRIYRAIVKSIGGENPLLPILRPYEHVGSSRFVSFETTKEVFATERSHINYVVADSSWEPKMAQVLEDMEEVICYVKNKGLYFYIPYTMDGRMHNYEPDYIVRINDGHANPLNLIVEVSGEPRKDKEIKVATARTFWIPAVNNHGGFGRWAFVDITDPWDAEHTIRSLLQPARTLR